MIDIHTERKFIFTINGFTQGIMSRVEVFINPVGNAVAIPYIIITDVKTCLRQCRNDIGYRIAYIKARQFQITWLKMRGAIVKLCSD